MQLENYRYRGARALVLLHEQHLRDFLETWRHFQISGVALPQTSDTDYASNRHLLRHVLGAARGYLVWICETLNLPDPEIRQAPSVSEIEAGADEFVAHVLERWRLPLADLPEEVFHDPTFPSRWNVHYCIDAMLEHAVMHPIRHTFQLQELLSKSFHSKHVAGIDTSGPIRGN
jgi:hypothetical protein